MTGTAGRCLGAAVLVMSLAGGSDAAPARRPAPRKTTASTKLSAPQIYQKFDSIEEQIKKLTAAIESGPKAAAPAPAVVAPDAGGGVATRDMSQAFYNYGVFSREAAASRTAARAIKLVTFVGGASLAFAGWESARDKTAPRTINNAYHDYPAFSYGITTMLLGHLVGMVMDFRADAADMKAARALMKPLETQTSATAPPPSSPAPATLAPASAAP